MYTKIAHNLLKTNNQNHKYYGASDRCPGCHTEPETLAHVLTCPASHTAAFWQAQEAVLWKNLEER
jgi:hypothetical protein